MEIDQHFIKEKLESKEIRIPYVASKDQLADFLKKGSLSFTFQFVPGKLRMKNIFESASRGVLKVVPILGDFISYYSSFLFVLLL